MFCNRLATASRVAITRRAFSSPALKNAERVKKIRAKYFYEHTMGAENPTYLKKPNDKYIFGAMATMTIFGVCNIFYGMYNAANGINKFNWADVE